MGGDSQKELRIEAQEMEKYGFDSSNPDEILIWRGLVRTVSDDKKPYDYSEDAFAFGSEQNPGQQGSDVVE
ncbi:MAG: hypothetical protein JWS12_746 [Candidatus Saccharibacteria bacterium]|nr:hypothetical protein [Candidatus Saccharibacteria bacterium]